jgi:hypothetical protein
MLHNLIESKLIGDGISPILLYTLQYKFRLLLRQKFILIRKIGDKEPRNKAKGNRNRPFDDLSTYT